MTSDSQAEGDQLGAPKSVITLCVFDFAIGVFSFCAWAVLFTLGTVVGTEQYRKAVGEGTGTFVDWLMVFTCYTVPNVLLLSVFSAFLGGLARRVKIAGRNTPSSIPAGPLAIYASAVVRGFFVYLIAVTGVFVVTAEQFVTPDQQGYLRLACLLSLLCFLTGFDPQFFLNLIRRAQRTNGDMESENENSPA